MKETLEKVVSQNKKAYHNYFIETTYLCGIELYGTEIKSIREGSVNLADSYAMIKKGEIYILGMHISPYAFGNIFNHDPDRDRKLLLHRSEILKITQKVQKAGYTLVPTKVILTHGLAKVELGLAKGKDLYDKRQDLKEASMKMEERKTDKLRNLQ
jgi:SsrA-binding protein